MCSHLKTRTLTESDFAFADTVRALAGWNQTIADWRRVLAHEPDGCFLAEWDGVSAGVVTTTRYGYELAWIGMMLVHPDYRRRGIASELMDKAIAYLRSKNVGCIKLDATPEGAQVYERLGFRPELELYRWKGDLKSVRKRLQRDPLPLPLEFDRRAFGADRSDWLASLASDAQVVRLIRDDADNPAAMGMIREGSRATYLGPISAKDESAGRNLVFSLLEEIDGPVYWDLPEENRDAISIAESYGFQRSRSLLRMWIGDRQIRGEPALQYGIGDPSTG